VKAAGSGAILDGSQGLTGQTWSAMSGVNKVWFLKLGRSIAYLARDEQRYYNYDSLAWLDKSLGHDGTSQMNEGWFYESSTGKLYVAASMTPPTIPGRCLSQSRIRCNRQRLDLDRGV